jgi:hypothetical protein
MARRQFDMKFKKKAVKAVAAARASGVWGLIGRTCEALEIRPNMVFMWERQIAAGLMTKKNAVAFSRNPSTMVRG